MKEKKPHELKQPKPPKSFASFCKQHKIAVDSIKWRTAGAKTVKLAIEKDDYKREGLNLISFGVMLAIREFDVGLEVTIREKGSEIEIIVEKE
jgi:hypothetical protein